MMPYVMNVDMLLTVVASAYLYRKLNKTKDLFNTSGEIVTVGMFSILAVGELVALRASRYFAKSLLRVGQC